MTQDGDATGGVIPYKNKCALIAYYLGIASIIPCLGFFLGIPAFILGIIGLINKNKNPAIKGTAHAMIGIIVGGGSVLVHILLPFLAKMTG